MITFVLYFLLWTFVIYIMHRLAHVVPLLQPFHWNHHYTISRKENDGKFKISHLILYVDNFETTIDQWLTEVIPTIIFCTITGQWWIAILYWIDAAFIQESIKHNPNFNVFPLNTAGRWHLIHHSNSEKNYGIIFPIWDIIFNTYEGLHKKL